MKCEPAGNNVQQAIVAVNNLKIHFPRRQGVFGKTIGQIRAVDGISFSIDRGSIFALVGESGCGKTTTAQAIAGLLSPTSGEITFFFSSSSGERSAWTAANRADRKRMRRKMQMIFQDPFSSLNPRMTVRAILEEPFLIHRLGGTASERMDCIYQLIEKVGLSRAHLNQYPHEFSGGQRQRIGIARAIATNPEFIIADEPVSALDVSIQAQIINLLRELRAANDQTQLFISHDLAVVRHIADRIAVMYRGSIVEDASESELFTHPLHPYTVLLLESVPVPGRGRKQRGSTIQVELEPGRELRGCPFFQRCSRRTGQCGETIPPLRKVSEGHLAACLNPVQ